MQVVRAVETALYEAGVRGDLEGPVHVSLGQEAVAVGTAAAMTSSDRMLSTHRGHGHALAMSLDPRRVVAEILCHPDGYGGGVGGSMHLVAEEHGFLGTNGIVGANAGLALGAALAAEHEANAGAVVCMIGDGAMGTGIVYESLNLAALWSLPLLFVCENNQYAEMTPTPVHVASPPHQRAASFGLASFLVDGDDVEQVQEALLNALAGARHGQPAFVECTTHRWTGHYVGDPQSYRPDGEAEAWRAHCPIQRLAKRLGQDPTEENARLLDEARRLVAELLIHAARR
jgi:TPP-dependent pyruvate/acetoin dehydrogenase alpha subunit